MRLRFLEKINRQKSLSESQPCSQDLFLGKIKIQEVANYPRPLSTFPDSFNFLKQVISHTVIGDWQNT